ncbi:MAG: DNA mismatch repair protein MutS [Planctomycetes bacterium]|nr:DNA mismatch repair protein MutS [Planctomycetota bacterium]
MRGPMTPLMEQYASIKSRHPEDILFFRLGDFYEMFYDDAKTAHRILGLTLTSRYKGEAVVPMCGVPHFSAETYIARLLRAGKRVAICDQTEDPDEADGLVDRAVVRVITPGTLTEDSLLDRGSANYLAAACVKGDRAGVAWLELSTAEFLMEEPARADLDDVLARIAPAECLVPEALRDAPNGPAAALRDIGRGTVTPVADWTFERRNAEQRLADMLGTANLDGFGVAGCDLGLSAAGAILEYCRETQRSTLKHLRSIRRYDAAGHVTLDRATQRALELTEAPSGDRRATLLGVLDRTVTPMGARLLRRWIVSPLRDRKAILARQEGVRSLVNAPHQRKSLQQAAGGVHDLERLAGRLGSGRANARDLLAVRQSLDAVPGLRATATGPSIFQEQTARCDSCDPLRARLARAIADDPPPTLQDGGLIRDGFNEELDRLRSLRRDGADWLARFQAEESRRSGIPSLKVGYNQVFGYYIEITHVHAAKIPKEYVRKQTLKNAERYITPELKQHETEVLNAETRSKELEYALFQELRNEAAAAIPALQRTAEAVAVMDVLASLAEVAAERRYVPPVLAEGAGLRIEGGRHPVLEQILAEKFVPNDATCDADGARLILLTGPNMAGKSTWLRQTALIALMAQIGSFVPAVRAEVGVVDRIFARVGAADDIARGNSTFLVEMSETANILHHATSRSLIILDEIGRGTSTFDGVAIAWAVAEYLHDRVGARTLFATHYHELTELSSTLPGARNYHVAVREAGDGIVFLRKIVEGGTDKSYGIHVARLAGIPGEVVARARIILDGLETGHEGVGPPRVSAPTPGELQQLSLFSPLPSPVAEALRRTDPDRLTPIEALQRLKELKDGLEGNSSGR